MQLTGTDLKGLPDVEERTALERCQRGDAQAFGVVVNMNMKRAYFAALGLVGNHADALDLSQEAFVRAYRAMPRFDLERRFFTWYYRILRNLCLNHLRDRARVRETDPNTEWSDLDDAQSDVLHDQADPAVLAERTDLNRHVWRAVARLKPEEREVFVLREVEDCSYAEIAERLEIPQGTVMSRLFHARQNLKDMLNRLL
jgi:RNA polymerase sigma-70 factor (ECF subfamily)